MFPGFISVKDVIVPIFPLNLVSTSSSTASNPNWGDLGNPYPKSTFAVSTPLDPPDVAIVPTTFCEKNPAPAAVTVALSIPPLPLVVIVPVALVVGWPPPAPPPVSKTLTFSPR